MVVFNRENGHLNYTGHNPDGEPLIDHLGKVGSGSNLFIDREGRLWFDNWEKGYSGLYAYDLRNHVMIHDSYSFLPQVKGYHELKGVIQQRNGDIWIKGLGVFGRYLENERRFQLVYNGYENEQSIAYDNVYSLFEDSEGNIWVSTNNNGLYLFNPREQFFTNTRQINRISNKPGNGGVMSFANTRRGTILVGTWGDGLYHYDRNLGSIPLRPLGIDDKASPTV
jgi:ligand-binding sensor domain-containing protein